jgi:competence protein ComEC
MISKKNILIIAGFLLALNVFAWQEVFELAGPHYLLVDFLSVGQGDAVFIKTPEGHKILIDGGPNSTVLEKLNARMPFWDKEIDLVILTHPEKDHMTGLLDVLQKYKVDYFLWTGVIKNDAENKKLAEVLKEAQKSRQNLMLASLSPGNTKVITTIPGQEIKAGNVLIDILFPLEDLAGMEPKSASNNTGVVSKITYGKNSFLFTADIDMASEKKIINSGDDIVSDVLKVAHHGSKYSSSEEFLQAVSPNLAVIEVGKNSYGHPTPEVLQRLQKYDIKTLRTDVDGDVKLMSDGNKINLYNN